MVVALAVPATTASDHHPDHDHVMVLMALMVVACLENEIQIRK